MDSILLTIKDVLGIESDFDGFDGEIIMAINSAIFSLGQLGVGPAAGLAVTNESQNWTDLFDGVGNLEAVKMYIKLHVRQSFDPPTTAHLIEALRRQITELEFRLAVHVEPDPA